VPRTGGIAIAAGIAAACALVAPGLPVILGAAAALGAVSFADDVVGLPTPARFAMHLAAAAAVLVLELGYSEPVLFAIFLFAIAWTANLYNFMDGSDGLAGGMTLFGFAAYALGAWLAGDGIFAALAGSVAAAAAAFLALNFPPARVFMGDAGSIPLGFLAATLGLLGWREGYWPIWFPVLVFSPFVLDASVTLARRVLHGERFWQAHRIHYYQRLVQLGWGHRNTALAEYALMAVCGGVALWALGQPPAAQWAALGTMAAVYVALALAVDLAWRRRRDEVRNDVPAH
jgi:UDP-N-acetylmuramyl pentapeptide phosphotransferase/UDP-N-acetylglucosamine-1-phosphate transferase